MKDLSKLTPVKPDPGKAQWVEGQVTGIAKDEPKRTHLIGIPPLMPCTTIFVHGVNSDGEWYRDAAAQFAQGLNNRLGRADIERLESDPNDKRRLSRENKDGKRARSPIIPFYWGYKVPPKLRIKIVDRERTTDRPDAWADRLGNPLRLDGSWGGGPFQNGTHNLLQFWQGGFDKTIGPLSLNLVNPIVGRTLHHGPERTCYVHAARRLAHLVTIVRRKASRHVHTWFTRLVMLNSVTLLTACGLTGPFPGVPDLHSPGRVRPQPVEIAAPQVAYRIDENRYFEIVPYGPGACTNAMVHFVDKAKGIRSEAVKLDRGSMLRATLIIDASNDQYLVAPVTRGNTDCSSGGGLCGGSKLPYSTDGGRTWKRSEAYSPSDDLLLQSSSVYASHDERHARSLDLEQQSHSLRDWNALEKSRLPVVAKLPLDNKFHCTVNGKE